MHGSQQIEPPRSQAALLACCKLAAHLGMSGWLAGCRCPALLQEEAAGCGCRPHQGLLAQAAAGAAVGEWPPAAAPPCKHMLELHRLTCMPPWPCLPMRAADTPACKLTAPCMLPRFSLPTHRSSKCNGSRNETCSGGK